MRTANKVIAFILTLLICVPSFSCGSTETPKTAADGSTSTDSGTTASEETEISYNYPAVDYGGYSFKLLNIDDFYNCYVKIDIGEQTGETVDDAVYKRNRSVEEKLNIKIEEIRQPFTDWQSRGDTIKSLETSVSAGDNAYDAAYLILSASPGVITDGYLVDLYTIPELHLDEDWWDTELNKSLEINGKLFGATSSLQLMSLGLSWVLLFNKELFDKNKLEYPYELVREGKWTLDKMNECVSASASLNGDDSFTYDNSGKAIYGIAAHETAPYMLLLASKNSFINRDNGGALIYTGANDRLFNSIDKIKSLLNVSEGKSLINSLDKMTDLGGYYNLFHSGRAVFLTTELKGTSVMRDMEADYGILPAPKYDENQENYITYASENIGRLAIPKTNDDLSRTAVILDALSYESKKNVLPLYYNQTISQKGLRDEDSIEMLDIINKSRMTEVGLIFKLTSTLVTSLRDMIKAGGDNAASIIAENENNVKENLNKLVEAIE